MLIAVGVLVCVVEVGVGVAFAPQDNVKNEIMTVTAITTKQAKKQLLLFIEYRPPCIVYSPLNAVLAFCQQEAVDKLVYSSVECLDLLYLERPYLAHTLFTFGERDDCHLPLVPTGLYQLGSRDVLI
jgi:hypothetical protein